MKSKAPLVTRELVEYLDKAFPDRCPSPEQKNREIWMEVGARRVVEHLRTLHQKQLAGEA